MSRTSHALLPFTEISLDCAASMRTTGCGPFDVGGSGVLLLFPQGGSLQPIETPGGLIPPHDGQGPMHVAFSISPDELEDWQRHLTEAGVPVEGRTQWPRGGVSMYFRDPDGHLLEIATPGMWRGY